MPIAPTHPYFYVCNLVEEHPEISTLEFSFYIYVPQTIADERIRITLSREEFLDPSQMDSLINSSAQTRELAVHSKVRLKNGRTMHIPMVDMSTAAKAHLIKLQNLLSNINFDGFEWFASGRSYHGYGKRLISDRDWRRLMGALLLSNQNGMMPIVDPRWIGHRLLAGYSALRWTRNTPHYLDNPRAITLK